MRRRGWLLNNNSNLTVEGQQEIVEQIRINIAFEQMLVSVLSGGALGGGGVLIINILEAIFGRGLTFQVVLSGILESLLVAFLIFLTGFFSSVVIGAPLFRALEKSKRRNVWPYLIVSSAVAVCAFLFINRGFPAANEFGFKALTATFLPAIVIALIFARRMRPYWRAAEGAEKNAITAHLLH